MDGEHQRGSGGGSGGQRRRGWRVPSSGRHVPPGRRGFWISLRGQNQGAVVEEGVDFAQDSEVGGGDDFLFVSDSDEESSEEISDDFVDVSFVPEIEDPIASNALASPSPATVPPHSIGSFNTNMEGVCGLEAGAWQDIAGHSQPPEEADVESLEPQEPEIGSDEKFREVRDEMLKILVPLYFKNARN